MRRPDPAPPFAIGFGSLLGVGALLRVWAFLLRGTLWNDEAGLALNVVSRGFAQLARPFVYQQYAPYLYLLSSKLLVTLAGPTERALRLSSLLAGCLLLPAILLLARRVGGWSAALFALAFVVPNPALVRYATEFKPYSLDALVSTVLCLLAVRVLSDTQNRRALMSLGLCGALAPWCSLPAVFVLAGCAAALAVSAWRSERGSATWAAPFVLGGLWAVSAALQYATFLRTSPADATDLERDWTHLDGFAPLPPQSLADLLWYPEKFTDLFDSFVAPGGFGLRYLALALWFLGMIALWRTQRPLFALVVTPLLLLFVAASAHKYAIVGRVLLFTVPLLIVPVVLALDELAELRSTRTQLAAAGCAALMCAGSSVQLARELPAPLGQGSIDQLVAQLRVHYRPGDKLYVERQVEWTYTFYARRVRFNAPFPVPDEPPSFENLDSLRGAPRVWVLLPAPNEARFEPGAEAQIAQAAQLVTQHLDTAGRALDAVDGGDARLYLYDLSVPP
jgi:hypothetical protein